MAGLAISVWCRRRLVLISRLAIYTYLNRYSQATARSHHYRTEPMRSMQMVGGTHIIIIYQLSRYIKSFIFTPTPPPSLVLRQYITNVMITYDSLFSGCLCVRSVNHPGKRARRAYEIAPISKDVLHISCRLRTYDDDNMVAWWPPGRRAISADRIACPFNVCQPSQWRLVC